MKILITGKKGQVARCLAHINTRHKLLFLARPDIDMRFPKSLFGPLLAMRPDVILSCAGMTNVDACEADEAMAFTVNAASPTVLASAANRLNIPIIHLSTDYVFGGRQTKPYFETDLVDPINIYGRSKLAGELAISEARRHVVVRTTWVYSPFGGFVCAALAHAGRGEVLRVVKDQIACPTSGLDLARALLTIAERITETSSDEFCGVFHGAGADLADRGMVLRAALNLAGFGHSDLTNVNATEFFKGAPRPLYSALDSSQINRVFGVKLRGWAEALGEMITYL